MSESSIAFIDLAGFAALTEAHGATAAADLATRFTELAHANTQPPARVVKTIGDAVMLHAPEPASALIAAAGLVHACLAEPEFPLARGGLDHGPVEERGGDYFGPTVNLAARLTAYAAGPRLLITDRVLPAARDAGFLPEPIGPLKLRNLSQPVHAYAITLDQPIGAVTDPVCRMRIDSATAPARLRQHGRDYWFCSRDCIAAFAADPNSYIDPTAL